MTPAGHYHCRSTVNTAKKKKGGEMEDRKSRELAGGWAWAIHDGQINEPTTVLGLSPTQVIQPACSSGLEAGHKNLRVPQVCLRPASGPLGAPWPKLQECKGYPLEALPCKRLDQKSTGFLWSTFNA